MNSPQNYSINMEKMLIADDYLDKAHVFRLILETEGYQAKAVDIGIKVIK